ncbi:MAG: WD40 repeat domain-containing protein [Pseudomonadota bacterium]
MLNQSINTIGSGLALLLSGLGQLHALSAESETSFAPLQSHHANEQQIAFDIVDDNPENASTEFSALLALPDDIDIGVFVHESRRFINFVASNYSDSDYLCDFIKVRAHYQDFFGDDIGFREVRSRRLAIPANTFEIESMAGEEVVCALENIFDSPQISRVDSDSLNVNCYPSVIHDDLDIVVNQSTLSDAQFSPDGRRLVVSSYDKTATVWDALNGQKLLTLRDDGWIYAATFSPDGQYIATAGNDEAIIWDAVSGLKQFELANHKGNVRDIAYSPNGQFIVTASSDKKIRIWQARSGALIRTLSGHTTYATAVRVSPDSRFILSASGDQTGKLWDMNTGALLQTYLGHTGTIVGVAFSHDGQSVVTSGWDNTAKIWRTFTGELVRTIEGHRSTVRDARFSDDGRWLLTGSDDYTARLWDLKTGEELALYEFTRYTNEVNFSPNGFAFATANGDGIVHIVSLLDRLNQQQPTQCL